MDGRSLKSSNLESENRLQSEIVTWYNNNFCLKHHNPRHSIFSVPNGGTRNIREAMTLKATGMKAGVSDLIILIPNKVIFVELKTDTGKQSEVQKDFQNVVENLKLEYYLIRSLDEFKETIEKIHSYNI